MDRPTRAENQAVIHVLATTYEGTRAALTTAIPLAKGAHARLVVVVTKIVPYALALDEPVDATDVVLRRYRNLVIDLDGDAHFRLCLCRRPDDVVTRLLPRRATVVVGGPTGGLLSSQEVRLARRMTQLGQHVVFVPMPHETLVSRVRSTLSLMWLLMVAFVLANSGQTAAQTPTDSIPRWRITGFADVALLGDPNTPSNHLFRNRGTTPRVNELVLNIAGIGLKKDATESSRWGTEITIHDGRDAETFGFSTTAPNIAGADWLRRLGPTDLSYLAPVGDGLTVQGGIFGSLIGYDSLYAKDNFSYTRPWGADYTPYLMLGVDASYPFNKKLTGTFAVVNGYWHLAHANDVPSVVGQAAYKATDAITVKQTVLYGPHQANTAIGFWRTLSDTIVEVKRERVTMAAEYQLGVETVDVAGNPRALWTSAQLPVHWSVGPSWSVTLRPEFCWDRDGRWTGAPESVVAFATTLEYRVPYRRAEAILRFEHRYDDSRGAGGGFFEDRGASLNVLTPGQHLLTAAAIVTFDSSARD